MFDRIWSKKVDNYRSRAEHVVVYETFNRCCMLKWGVVHHLDFNKLNNNPKNLRGMTNDKHKKYHDDIEQFLKDVAKVLLDEGLKRMKEHTTQFGYEEKLKPPKRTWYNPEADEKYDEKDIVKICVDFDDIRLQSYIFNILRNGMNNLDLDVDYDNEKQTVRFVDKTSRMIFNR